MIMSDKPIIRHCRNCKYGVCRYSDISDFVVECSVKYKSIVFPRLAALLCRYYKEKDLYDHEKEKNNGI